MKPLCALLLLVVVAGCTFGPRPRPLAWDVLGDRAGESAPKLEDDALALMGVGVQSQRPFSLPVTVAVEASLAEPSPNGTFFVAFVPEGQPPNHDANAFVVAMTYRDANTGEIRAFLNQGDRPKDYLKATSFELSEGSLLRLNVFAQANGVEIQVNGRTFQITEGSIPYSSFQIRLRGMTPTNNWRVHSFVVR